MTGNLGGTNHSALARSNERALRQSRNCAAIDKRESDTLTFESVRETVRAYDLVFKDGTYTVKNAHAGVHKWILAMLKDVGATIVNTEGKEIQFLAPVSAILMALRTASPLPMWQPDEILMLPAPEPLLMLPAKTGIQRGDKVMIGQTKHTVCHFGAEIYTRYEDVDIYTATPKIACYTQAQIEVFNGGIAQPDETAKRARATLCPPPKKRASMYTSAASADNSTAAKQPQSMSIVRFTTVHRRHNGRGVNRVVQVR